MLALLHWSTINLHLTKSILVIIQGDSKKMSPLAFKPNNIKLMRRTTLPDTAFERADNFLSNECIHTLFSFQIASSQAANQKSSGFCVFRFQTDFDEREHFVLSSLYRNIAFIVICELRTRHPGPTRASIIFLSHWSLCSKQPPSEVKLPAWGIAGMRGPGSPGSADSDRKATSGN